MHVIACGFNADRSPTIALDFTWLDVKVFTSSFQASVL